jgi:DNA repair photolyase
MIISASRRTDIPTYYSDWFFNRIKEGFVLVRNPMNNRQISRIKLTPDVVDGIVFWTKNPIPMLDRLDELKDYMYYFQFTITPYGKDIEPNLPTKPDEIIAAFKRLSDAIGADRVVWRYDPILVSERYSLEYHIRAFSQIAEYLHDYTQKVTISFIDEDYRCVKSNIKELALLDFPTSTQMQLSSSLAEIAHSYGLKIDTCAERIESQQFGIEHARCIDDRLLAHLLGCRLDVDKDKTQRLECGCVTSIDIGMYNTCRNGCRYCYANYSQNTVAGNYAKHNPLSPLISGEVGSDDKIHDRAVKSCKDMQLNFSDG